MCGITGFINKNSKTKKEKILKNMLNRIVHRGPDSMGIYVDEEVALGFRRLSIIDLKGGNQPIYNEKKDKAILFNGEIYNFQELRQELIEKGHKFTTKTDTETILHGFEEYGERIVDKLRGMFTFVIWDINKKELFGARDPFGIKPFYYASMGDTFMFGSEIKSFLDHPDFKKELNKEALRPYLTFQYSVLPETFFKGVYKLEPGHCFTIKKGKLKIKEYYDTIFNAKDKRIDEYVEDIASEVKKSVEYHKISDVKVGSFLSGGVDSSYITNCLMPDETFSVGFKNKGFSEVDHAKDLSKILKIKNFSKIITPDEFFKEVKNIQYYSDEPHANLSAVPLYFLSRLAKEHVTVVLSGEGADELFGGYDSYFVSSLDSKYRKIPKFIRYPLGKISQKLPKFHGRNFLTKNGLPVEDYYIGQAMVFNENEAKHIVQDDYQHTKTVKQITKPFFDKVKDKDDLTKMQYLDMHLWLPQDILLKADKMTMAHSLELRVPFLDREVMNLARKIPTKYKLQNNTTKYVFRQAAYKILPEEWAKRPKKGFPVPFAKWILDKKYYNKVKTVFSENYVNEFFDQAQVLNLLEEHYKGHKNNGRKIWTIYAFLLWYKVYFIGEN
ncbi:MAG: asparagine synthase (glutamine-hydrolyzing) [Bacilli bacterium]